MSDQYRSGNTSMKIKKLGLVIVSCLTIEASAQQFVPGQLLVQERDGADPAVIAQAISTHGASHRASIPQLKVHVLRVPEPALETVRQNLLRTGLFTFAERDAIAKGALIPNDPSYPSEWHLPIISGPSAWDITTGSALVTIAIVDSGVDSSHPDLSSKIVAGWNWVNGTSNTADDYGHGTAVAGSVAAGSNNGTGVASVAWANMIMPLVVLDSTDSASYSNMASAITYAADHGARIINMSLGSTYNSSALQSATDYAWSKGAVVFAAAGNNGSSTPFYPAANPNVVAVSATNSTDALASWSNYGNWIDLAAPGDTILTTNNGGGYGYWSGTSFSSPIAAGVAALVLSLQPALSNSALVSLLENNSDDLGTAGYDQYYGWGRVNAYKALLAVKNVTIDTTPPTVSIATPLSGAVLAGITNVQGTATDNVGVTKVDFYLDTQLLATGSSGSFLFTWDTTTAANGSHTLTVKAYDAANNVGQAAVTVSVNNTIIADTTPPVVSITSPANGATVSGSTKVNVSATDNVAVAQVVIYIDGVKVYTGSAAPYTYNWNTRKVKSGSHIITTNAWDRAGNMGSAQPVTVKK